MSDFTSENRGIPGRILNSPRFTIPRIIRPPIINPVINPPILPRFRRNAISFSFDTISDEEDEPLINIDLIHQQHILNKMSEQYPYEEDFVKLKELVQDIDKQNEATKNKNMYLKLKITNMEKDLNILEKYKENYLKTVKNIPLHLVKEKIINNKCSICLENENKIGENYVLTVCFHTFHEDCLIQAVNINNKCPLCRTELKHSFYKKIQIDISDKEICYF